MKVEMIRIKNQKTGETNEMSVKLFTKKLKKTGGNMGSWAIDSYFTKELKSFKFVAWVHPIKGGDDYQVEVDQVGNSKEEAEKYLREWLGTKSIVVDDYQMVAGK